MVGNTDVPAGPEPALADPLPVGPGTARMVEMSVDVYQSREAGDGSREALTVRSEV
jgi:hypothetical protein